MLPYTHPLTGSASPLWDRDQLLGHLGLPATAASLKRVEREASQSGYFPPLLQPSDIRDQNDQPLLANLTEAEIAGIKARRGKWLAVHRWQQAGKPDMICANDGRGGRQWMFAEKDTSPARQLAEFCQSLSAQSKQPILLFLHGELAAERLQVAAPQPLKVARLAYREIYNIPALSQGAGTVPGKRALAS